VIGRPRRLPVDMNALAKRIKELRLKLHKSQTAFAEVVGVSQPTIVRWEKGEDTPEDERIRVMAKMARQSFIKFKYGQSSSEVGNFIVPVMGVIGTGEEVKKSQGGGEQLSERVSAPEGLEAEGLFALRVTGNSFRPIKDGWLAYYHQAEGVADDAIGELCVVELASGERLVKDIRRGSKPGLYTLLSWNANVDPLEDQVVKSASVILSFKHP